MDDDIRDPVRIIISSGMIVEPNERVPFLEDLTRRIPTPVLYLQLECDQLFVPSRRILCASYPNSCGIRADSSNGALFYSPRGYVDRMLHSPFTPNETASGEAMRENFPERFTIFSDQFDARDSSKKRGKRTR